MYKKESKQGKKKMDDAMRKSWEERQSVKTGIRNRKIH